MELGGFYVKIERVLIKNGGKFMGKNIKFEHS